MRAYYGAWLVIEGAGPLVPRLCRLATFRRKGRVPTGEDRIVPFYQIRGDTVWLPRGLLGAVRRLVPDLEVVNRTLVFQRLDFGWRGRLRPEQSVAVARVVRRGGGMLVAPPGTGKTEMGMAAIAAFGQPALWLTHTKDLARDALGRARRLYNLPRGAIGYLGERQDLPGTHLTVAMVQTLTKRPDLVAMMRHRIGTIVSDEDHHDASLTRSRLISQFPARYRVGLTATHQRTDGLEGLVYALMGGIAIEIPHDYAFKAGRLVRPTVRLIPTGWQSHGDVPWSVLQRSRAESGMRNALICRLAAREIRRGRHVMVLVELVDHARFLAQALRERYGTPAHAVVGSVPPEARRRIYDEVERGQAVLVATKLADEGLDLPALDTLILGAPGRSAPRLKQQVGRIMRIFREKRDAIVYDLCDLDVPALARQAEERLKVYEELGMLAQRQPQRVINSGL